MRVAIERKWSFEEAAIAAIDAYGYGGLMNRGARLNVMRSWGNVVGRKRALKEIDEFTVKYGGAEKTAQALGISVSSLKTLRRFYSKLPTDAIQKFEQIQIKMKFNHPVDLEETRKYEFKEIIGINPVNTIKNTADEYAVSFLNSDGGTILWGIRNSDRCVTGVRLNFSEKDEVRRVISNHLATIQPPIDPTAYRVGLHPIYANETEIISDLYVVELTIPSANSSILYFTGGNEAFVRIDGLKKKLKGPEIQDWIMRRLEKEKN